MRAVVLAGGRGTRLAPYTTVLPKPLMPVGDMPILEILLRQLRVNGVTSVSMAVGHLASLIMAYFGTGERVGIPIEYSFEEQPLGTAGPIKLIRNLDGAFLAMNGDLLTDVDFRGMMEMHRRQAAAMTVGVYERDTRVELGVIETDAAQCVTRYIEKPVYHYKVSMGVYVMEPRVLEFIPADVRFDLPDLVEALLARRERVVGYTHSGYWLDIGREDDYRRAQEDAVKICQGLTADDQASKRGTNG